MSMTAVPIADMTEGQSLGHGQLGRGRRGHGGSGLLRGLSPVGLTLIYVSMLSRPEGVLPVWTSAELAEYLTAYVLETAFGDGDPEEILDRHHDPGIEWYSDGVQLDRHQLVAHAGPVRRNVADCRVDVRDALVEGDRFAARYTLRATMRKGRTVETEIYVFGR